MSGDVQPRKRKDKKRRKEHVPEEDCDETEIMHVQGDDHVGGGRIAKIVFFILLSVLVYFSGQMLYDNRGLIGISETDIGSSRFGYIFEGWLEELHDDHDHAVYSNHDYHAEADLRDDHDEHDDDHDNIHKEEQTDEQEEDEEGNDDEDDTEHSEVQEKDQDEDQEEEPEVAHEDVEEEDHDSDLGEDQDEDQDEAPEESAQEDNEENNDKEDLLQSAEQADDNTFEDDVSATDHEVSDEADENDGDGDKDEDYENEDTNEDTNYDDDDNDPKPTDNDDEGDNKSTEKDVDADEAHYDSQGDADIKNVGSVEENNMDISNEVNEVLLEDSSEIIFDNMEEKEEMLDNTSSEEELLENQEEEREQEDQNESETVEEGEFEVRVDDQKGEKAETENDSQRYKTEDKNANNFLENTWPELNTSHSLKFQNILKSKEKNDVSPIRKSAELNTDLSKIHKSKIQTIHPSNIREFEKKEDTVIKDIRHGFFITSCYNLQQKLRVSNEMFLVGAEKCIDTFRSTGQPEKAIPIHSNIIYMFPDDPKHRNQLVVTLLIINRLSAAKRILKETLRLWPNDSFAQMHFGFVLKVKDNNMAAAIGYLRSGINSFTSSVPDGIFFFHLGDALTRLGKPKEAYKVYEKAVSKNVFLSKYQRSLYNVKMLIGRPWWSKEQTPHALFFKSLEENWLNIRAEGLALLSEQGYFKNDAENLIHTGEWKQLVLYSRGVKRKNCVKCPLTCKLIEKLPAARDCRRGQAKFSVLHPGTHIWPHCGPTNCRLRSHLGLKVPSNTSLRVGHEMRQWKEGEILIFDDSFEHEVWHNGSGIRLVLIVDIWHPELTEKDKRALPSI